jgi:hypothetical protein
LSCRDNNGQLLAYVYYENEPGRRSAAKLHQRRGAEDCREYCEVARTIIDYSVIFNGDEQAPQHPFGGSQWLPSKRPGHDLPHGLGRFARKIGHLIVGMSTAFATPDHLQILR